MSVALWIACAAIPASAMLPGSTPPGNASVTSLRAASYDGPALSSALPSSTLPGSTSSGADSLGAHSARALSVNDTGHLHLLKAFGSVLIEEGSASGTLPGEAKVRLTIGSTVIASFTIQTGHGTIYGSGRAALHSSGRYASFGGLLSVSHGSGAYADAHGSGKLYGAIDRRTDAVTVQTIGTLSY